MNEKLYFDYSLRGKEREKSKKTEKIEKWNQIKKWSIQLWRWRKI